MNRLNERFWYGVVAVLAAVELEAVRRKHNAGTISHAARKAYRTETKVGKVMLVTSWTALSLWLIPHLLKQAENSLEALMDAVTVEG